MKSLLFIARIIILISISFTSAAYADGTQLKITVDNKNGLGRVLQILPFSYQSTSCPQGVNTLISNLNTTVHIQDGQSYDVLVTADTNNSQDRQCNGRIIIQADNCIFELTLSVNPPKLFNIAYPSATNNSNATIVSCVAEDISPTNIEMRFVTQPFV